MEANQATARTSHLTIRLVLSVLLGSRLQMTVVLVLHVTEFYTVLLIATLP